MPIADAALRAGDYGYFVTRGTDGIHIQRKRNGDGVALVRDDGTIVPYADDFNAQDYLVARAVAES